MTIPIKPLLCCDFRRRFKHSIASLATSVAARWRAGDLLILKWKRWQHFAISKFSSTRNSSSLHRNDYKNNDIATWRFKYEIVFMNFLKYIFVVNSGYDSTLTMTILYRSQIFKNNVCSNKVRFDYLEMHTITLDLYLIGIVAWWMFDSKSVNLAIYQSTVAIVCIGKYREVQCKWKYYWYTCNLNYFQKDFCNLDWLEFGLIIANWPYLSQLLVCWHT